MPTQPDPRTLAARYIAVWTEPDPVRRRAAVEELWAPGGCHILHPPEEIRTEAARLGFDTVELRATGHAAIELRVERAFQEFVAPGEFTFRACEDAVLLADTVKLNWEMVQLSTGESVGGGVDFLILDADGLIQSDYQFPGP